MLRDAQTAGQIADRLGKPLQCALALALALPQPATAFASKEFVPSNIETTLSFIVGGALRGKYVSIPNNDTRVEFPARTKPFQVSGSQGWKLSDHLCLRTLRPIDDVNQRAIEVDYGSLPSAQVGDAFVDHVGFATGGKFGDLSVQDQTSVNTQTQRRCLPGVFDYPNDLKRFCGQGRLQRQVIDEDIGALSRTRICGSLPKAQPGKEDANYGQPQYAKLDSVAGRNAAPPGGWGVSHWWRSCEMVAGLLLVLTASCGVFLVIGVWRSVGVLLIGLFLCGHSYWWFTAAAFSP